MRFNYKGVLVGVWHDEYGTELNEILDCGAWEPLDNHCYISDEHLTVDEIIEYLEREGL